MPAIAQPIANEGPLDNALLLNVPPANVCQISSEAAHQVWNLNHYRLCACNPPALGVCREAAEGKGVPTLTQRFLDKVIPILICKPRVLLFVLVRELER